MRPIAFIDTETTSLRHDRLPWEVAIIPRDPGESDYIERICIDVPIVDADPQALQIGGYWGRKDKTLTIHNAAGIIRILTHNATIVAANPHFDLGALENLLRTAGLVPSWHYRSVCVESLVLGSQGQGEVQGLRACIEAIGVYGDFAWHTALGDALAVRAIYDHIVARTDPTGARQ